MSDMTEACEKVVGKTVERVEVHASWQDNSDRGFTMYFTDGTVMEVSSNGFNDCSSVVTVDVD